MDPLSHFFFVVVVVTVPYLEIRLIWISAVTSHLQLIRCGCFSLRPELFQMEPWVCCRFEFYIPQQVLIGFSCCRVDSIQRMIRYCAQSGIIPDDWTDGWNYSLHFDVCVPIARISYFGRFSVYSMRMAVRNGLCGIRNYSGWLDGWTELLFLFGYRCVGCEDLSLQLNQLFRIDLVRMQTSNSGMCGVRSKFRIQLN